MLEAPTYAMSAPGFKIAAIITAFHVLAISYAPEITVDSFLGIGSKVDRFGGGHVRFLALPYLQENPAFQQF